MICFHYTSEAFFQQGQTSRLCCIYRVRLEAIRVNSHQKLWMSI